METGPDGMPTAAGREASLVAGHLSRRGAGQVTAWAVRAGEGAPGVRKLAGFLAGEMERRGRPLAVVAPAAPTCAAVGATLSARLDVGMVSHCVGVLWPEGLGPGDDPTRVEFLVPAFGGLAVITCRGTWPLIFTVSEGAARRLGPDGSAALGTADGPEPSGLRSISDDAGPTDEGSPGGYRLLGVRTEPSAPPGASLGSARVVVAGGAGAASSGTWEAVTALASLLGAAVGATRPVVDEGLAPEAAMIGQSGVRVRPDLYIALGISGDLQHVVGLEGARLVVAVNKDPGAPIFTRADYGVVADLARFLPCLLNELRGPGEPGRPVDLGGGDAP